MTKHSKMLEGLLLTHFQEGALISDHTAILGEPNGRYMEFCLKGLLLLLDNHLTVQQLFSHNAL